MPELSAFDVTGLEKDILALKHKSFMMLDFWATWCGPCKSSFPGMQMAQEKYQSDGNVAFVFIDTWERVPVDQKAQTAGDFINSKKYPFNVLLDLDDRVVGSYNVSGIPTKFILDKSGIIRFKSVGYSGSSEKLVEELSLMIDLTKNM
jgi:thiol-disulfide isomerase/thioredoxin